MRAYFFAGLVSLSFAACSGSAALAQQPLWSTPQVLDAGSAGAPGSKSTPNTNGGVSSHNPSQAVEAAASKATALSQRLGELFSKPGSRLAIAMGNEQAAIVTAGSVGEASSPQSLGVPWASHPQERFSFAEIDSTNAQPLGARGTRGAQVSPMRSQISRQPSAQESLKASEISANMTVPWHDIPVVADRPLANWPFAEQAPMMPASQRPNRIKPGELPNRPQLQAQLTSSAKLLEPSSDDLSLVLPVTSEKLEFQPAIPPRVDTAPTTPTQIVESAAHIALPDVRPEEPSSRVAKVPQQASGGLPSASDLVPQVLQAPQVPQVPAAEPPTTGRITDKANDIADKTNKPAESSRRAEGSVQLSPPIKGSLAGETPLLSTDSMIGPLKGAEELFHRLDLVEDLRSVAALAPAGPREDLSQYGWMPTPYSWISPAFYHYPLYFEQPNLERYGIGRAPVVQPLLSSAHFFWSIPLVPYKTLTHHPREHVYTLGQGRPGNCVPVQGGVILGPSTVGEVSMFWEQGSGY